MNTKAREFFPSLCTTAEIKGGTSGMRKKGGKKLELDKCACVVSHSSRS